MSIHTAYARGQRSLTYSLLSLSTFAVFLKHLVPCVSWQPHIPAIASKFQNTQVSPRSQHLHCFTALPACQC